jgi:hypothetical protein
LIGSPAIGYKLAIRERLTQALPESATLQVETRVQDANADAAEYLRDRPGGRQI